MIWSGRYKDAFLQYVRDLRQAIKLKVNLQKSALRSLQPTPQAVTLKPYISKKTENNPTQLAPPQALLWKDFALGEVATIQAVFSSTTNLYEETVRTIHPTLNSVVANLDSSSESGIVLVGEHIDCFLDWGSYQGKVVSGLGRYVTLSDFSGESTLNQWPDLDIYNFESKPGDTLVLMFPPDNNNELIDLGFINNCSDIGNEQRLFSLASDNLDDILYRKQIAGIGGVGSVPSWYEDILRTYHQLAAISELASAEAARLERILEAAPVSTIDIVGENLLLKTHNHEFHGNPLFPIQGGREGGMNLDGMVTPIRDGQDIALDRGLFEAPARSQPIAQANDMEYEEMLWTYYRLATLPELSEVEAKRLEKILDAAQANEQLNFLINEVDELTFQQLGFLEENSLQGEAEQKRRIREELKRIAGSGGRDRNTKFTSPPPDEDSPMNLSEPDYEAILADYSRLAMLPELSEVEAKRLEKMLDAAQEDEQLSLLMNEVDELTFQQLGFLEGDGPLRHNIQKLKAREQLELAPEVPAAGMPAGKRQLPQWVSGNWRQKLRIAASLVLVTMAGQHILSRHSSAEFVLDFSATLIQEAANDVIALFSHLGSSVRDNQSQIPTQETAFFGWADIFFDVPGSEIPKNEAYSFTLPREPSAKNSISNLSLDNVAVLDEERYSADTFQDGTGQFVDPADFSFMSPEFDLRAATNPIALIDESSLLISATTQHSTSSNAGHGKPGEKLHLKQNETMSNQEVVSNKNTQSPALTSTWADSDTHHLLGDTASILLKDVPASPPPTAHDKQSIVADSQLNQMSRVFVFSLDESSNKETFEQLNFSQTNTTMRVDITAQERRVRLDVFEEDNIDRMSPIAVPESSTVIPLLVVTLTGFAITAKKRHR